jgi:hypothetical protein
MNPSNSLVLVTLAVLAGAATLNWGSLVAAGVAPLLLAVAPCAAMCALGLCMSRMGGKSCSTTAPHEAAHHAAVHEKHPEERKQGQAADHG